MNKLERSKNAANLIGKHEVVRDEIICAIMKEVKAIIEERPHLSPVGFVSLISPQFYLSERKGSFIVRVFNNSDMINDKNKLVEATEVSTSDLSSILLNLLS